MFWIYNARCAYKLIVTRNAPLAIVANAAFCVVTGLVHAACYWLLNFFVLNFYSHSEFLAAVRAGGFNYLFLWRVRILVGNVFDCFFLPEVELINEIVKQPHFLPPLGWKWRG